MRGETAPGSRNLASISGVRHLRLCRREAKSENGRRFGLRDSETLADRDRARTACAAAAASHVSKQPHHRRGRLILT